MALTREQLAEITKLTQKYAELDDPVSLRRLENSVVSTLEWKEKLDSATTPEQQQNYQTLFENAREATQDMLKELDAELANMKANSTSIESQNVKTSPSQTEPSEPQSNGPSKPHVNRFLWRQYTGTVDGRPREITEKDDLGKKKRYEGLVNEIDIKVRSIIGMKGTAIVNTEIDPKTAVYRLKTLQADLVKLRTSINSTIKAKGHSQKGERDFIQLLQFVDKRLETIDKCIKNPVQANQSAPSNPPSPRTMSR